MSHLPGALQQVPFPVIGSPLFIVSNPQLLIAQCKAGIVGSMPALNARPAEQLEDWLAEITETLAAHNRAHPDNPAAPFAINQIVHKTNERLEHDMALCEKYKVPILITSLGAREDVNQAAHRWGGVVLHDIINNTFAPWACTMYAFLLSRGIGLRQDKDLALKVLGKSCKYGANDEACIYGTRLKQELLHSVQDVKPRK